jgi:hypothetical protein
MIVQGNNPMRYENVCVFIGIKGIDITKANVCSSLCLFIMEGNAIFQIEASKNTSTFSPFKFTIPDFYP